MSLLPEPYESIRRETGVPPALVVAGLLGVWLVPGLLAGTETYAFWLIANESTPPWRAFAAQVPGWLTFALLTPVVLRFGEWVPAGRLPLAARAAAHIGLAVALGGLVALVAATAWTAFIGGSMPFGRLVLSWYLAGLPTAVLCYFGILGAGRAIYWFWRHRRSEVEAARLEAQLSDARLDALRMQLNPHFFFNSLNTATVLVRDGDTRAAEEVLELLGELMRETLRSGRRRMATLADEVAFIRRYLAIEEVRFSDRLRIEVDVPPELAEVPVPAFLLQPIVENAVRHGIARRPGAGRIGLSAARDDGLLVIRVEDDGPGPEPTAPENGGTDDGAAGSPVGLSNTRARLTALYGDRAVLTLTRAPDGGAVAEIRLPADG
ncbi:MAG: sensor histidine kinase [Gemmatimonadota bacterium]